MNAKQIIISNKAILAAALLTLGLTGCALTPATESLNYQAQTGVAHVAHAENVTVNVVTTDSRAEKKIGQKINTFGMKMADISADQPVDTTVDSAIEKELKSRGFHIDGKSSLKVSADVTKFYSDTTQGWHMHHNAEVNLAVTVKNNSNTVYSKLIKGVGETESSLALSTKDVVDSLGIALTDAMINLFNDKDFITTLTSSTPVQASAN
jgi:uncharacterized lipoprotein YajG